MRHASARVLARTLRCRHDVGRHAAGSDPPVSPLPHIQTPSGEITMSLIRWTARPLSSELSFRRELDRLFEDVFTSPTTRSEWAPATMPVDVEETAAAYVFRADLPGIEAKDVKVSLEGDTSL